MSRLSEIFAANRRCFIPFVTAGHPDLESSHRIILELARAGSQIVEVGLPFSDPIADGPVIQQSSFAALRHQYSLADYLDLIRTVRRESEVGLIFMTYLNPVLRYGLKRLESEAVQAGLDGILISDLTPEEYRRMEPIEKLDTVFLAAPTSSDSRLRSIADVCRGFLYLVARTGVTGRHTNVGDELVEIVARIRRFSSLPVAVGFGISSAADVEKVWQYAEGAVVGTALVRFIEENRENPDLAERVGEYVRRSLLP